MESIEISIQLIVRISQFRIFPLFHCFVFKASTSLKGEEDKNEIISRIRSMIFNGNV